MTGTAPAPPAIDPHERGAWRAALGISGVALAVRLALAAATPLLPDESYYWTWSRRLAAGYFDHPGAIAWLIRGGTAVAGPNPLGVRLLPVLCGALAVWTLLLAARRLAGARAARDLALLLALMPLPALGLVLATPDAPLVAGASLALAATLRATGPGVDERAALGWWLLAGAGAGLAMVSKYTAVLVPAGITLALVADRRLWRHLARPGPYAAVVVAAAVFAPVIWWNATHDWVSFRFQLHHGFAAAGGSVVRRELLYAAGQAAVGSPVVLALAVAALWRALRGRGGPSDRLLAVVAVTIWLFFAWSARNRPAEPNWPELAWLPAALLVARHAGRPRSRRWFQAALGVAAAMSLLGAVHALHPLVSLGGRRDPTAQGFGWDSVAAAMSRARDSLGAARPGHHAWLGADRYQDASAIALHVPDEPDVWSLNLGGRPNQFDLWPRFPERAAAGDDLVLALDESAGTPAVIGLLTASFRRIDRGAPLVLLRGDLPVARRRMWLLQDYTGVWPPSKPARTF